MGRAPCTSNYRASHSVPRQPEEATASEPGLPPREKKGAVLHLVLIAKSEAHVQDLSQVQAEGHRCS